MAQSQFFQKERGKKKRSAAASSSASSSRKRRWETPEQSQNRDVREKWRLLKRTRVRNKRVCAACGGTAAVHVRPCEGVNSGYGYVKQCMDCLKSMANEGWGHDKTFSCADDKTICRLLNAHGAPMRANDDVSGMHFYRSALAFHRELGDKQWDALVTHIREDFTTTTTVPCSALADYRGWYNRRTQTRAVQE